MKLAIILTLLLIPCLSQTVTINALKLCSCSEYAQQFCTTQNTIGQCVWNVTSTKCVSTTCSQIQTQADCLISWNTCYWNSESCLTFNNDCSTLSSTDLSCSEQNLQCYGSTGTCMNDDELPSCVAMPQSLCGTPGYDYGFGGEICTPENGSCQMAFSCYQLPQQQCQRVQKYCIWLDDFCSVAACQYLSESECTFVFWGMNPQQIIPCQFINGSCLSINATELTSENCSSLTLLNYRWVGNTTDGLCLSCQINPTHTYQGSNVDNRCSCAYYINQNNCQQTSYCQWSNNQCQELLCTQLINHASCITNQQCYWQQGKCFNFTSCTALNIFGESRGPCLATTLNCPLINSRTLTCQGVSSTACNQYQGEYQCEQDTGGLCYWSEKSSTCSLVTSCKQIQTVQYCKYFSYACYWKDSKCQQLTCESIINQQACKAVIEKIYSNTITACYWSNNKCQTVTNYNSLTQATCSINSDFTYVWTGKYCISCQKNQIKLPQRCSCSQLKGVQECQTTPQCMWKIDSCQDIDCFSILYQYQCNINSRCQWSKDGCINFISCESVIGANQKECLSMTINCPSSNGVNCQDQSNLILCNQLTSNSLCVNAYEKDGFCQWNSTSSTCSVLQKCSQILTQKECTYFSHSCIWTTSCQTISCSTYSTVSTCQYYYQTVNSATPIPCYWSSSTNTCLQASAIMQQLTSSTCYQNSDKTARWSSLLNQCITCQFVSLPNPYGCSCSQLLSQINCYQSFECQWNSESNSCQQTSCQTSSQQLCIANSQCMWISNQCQTFTSCSSLKAWSNEECQSQSLYCPIYNTSTKQCQQQLPLAIHRCNDQTQSTCSYYGSRYYECQWSNINNQCELQSICNFDYQTCSQDPLCNWTVQDCQPKVCSDYLALSECTFVLDAINDDLIQSCQWIDGKCVNAQSNSFYNAQTCYENTNQASRWSSNSSNSGMCIPCNLQIQLEPKNKCSCSQLASVSECNVSKTCWWNESEYSCEENSQCNMLSRISCIQNLQCYWSNSYCDQIPSISLGIFCPTLKGNSSLECLSQTILCPVSFNGTCQDQSHMQTCLSMQTEQVCVNSIGQEGYCTYSNQTCHVLSNCTQIKTAAQCAMLSNTCQWNQTTSSCMKLFCQDYTTQEQCTYIYQSINKANIQICEWNASTKICTSATYLLQSSQDTCYSSTGGTYHWTSSNTNGTCISCALNLIQPAQICSCNVLTEQECLTSSPFCRLNESNQCIESNCNQLLDSVNCSQLTKCMWQSGQCNQFTNCSDLKGITSLNCIAQSIQCQGLSNGVCQSKSDLQSCSQQYSSQSTCKLGSIGSDGFCYWDPSKDSCTILKTCDQIQSAAQCQSFNSACVWSKVFSSCVPYKCQNYLSSDDCTYVVEDLNDPYIELCVWQNNMCQPYDGKYYRFEPESCYENSAHTYRWLKEDEHGVKCQQCRSQILAIFGIIVIYIMHI